MAWRLRGGRRRRPEPRHRHRRGEVVFTISGASRAFTALRLIDIVTASHSHINELATLEFGLQQLARLEDELAPDGAVPGPLMLALSSRTRLGTVERANAIAAATLPAEAQRRLTVMPIEITTGYRRPDGQWPPRCPVAWLVHEFNARVASHVDAPNPHDRRLGPDQFVVSLRHYRPAESGAARERLKSALSTAEGLLLQPRGEGELIELSDDEAVAAAVMLPMVAADRLAPSASSHTGGAFKRNIRGIICERGQCITTKPRDPKGRADRREGVNDGLSSSAKPSTYSLDGAQKRHAGGVLVSTLLIEKPPQQRRVGEEAEGELPPPPWDGVGAPLVLHCRGEQYNTACAGGAHEAAGIPSDC